MARKNTKRKKKERRLLLLLLLLLGTGTLLGTATYAWFTANTRVRISPIDVNVSTSSGIQISADGSNWKSVLSKSDLTGASSTYAAAVNQLPDKMEPVSTGGTITDGKLEMFLGKITTNEGGDFILTAERSVETNSSGSESTGKFVAFDFFLKNEAEETVYLTPDSKVTFKTDTTDTGIKNATRVAFIQLNHVAATATLANIQANKALGSGESYPFTLWEPNYDAHTAFGVSNAENPYGVTGLSEGTGNNIVTYYGVKAAVAASDNIKREEANPTKDANKFVQMTPTLTTVSGYDTQQTFATLQPGITKYRVYMWIEGQDVDCENNASGGDITFTLQFAIDE